MSNGESLDGFVFPPFIPTASTRPAVTPPAVPQPSVQEPAPAAEPAEAGRMTMPWDLETPIVRQDDDAPAPAAMQSAADDDEDLPWLEVPTPREAPAPADEAPAAANEAFPEWLAWDQRDGIAAEAEARDTVAPIAGLEDFVPVDELGGGFVAPPPAAEWAPAENDASPFDAEPVAGFEAAPPPSFDATPSFEVPPAFGSADAEPFPDLVFDDAPSADSAPAGAWSPAAEAPPADEWSLAAPEAAEPPALYDAPPPPFEASPAAAEPSFEVSLDDGALSIEPAEAPSFLADEEPMFAPEPAPDAGAPQPFAWDDEPVTASDRQPFVADEEVVLASEPEPFGAEEDAVIAAEPDPFTVAAVAEAEAVAPAAPTAADSPFDDVAARLEDIARMLRERPDELLAGGSSDPLALLVTGYVMGYTARGGR
jgi:hypothetical protein